MTAMSIDERPGWRGRGCSVPFGAREAVALFSELVEYGFEDFSGIESSMKSLCGRERV